MPRNQKPVQYVQVVWADKDHFRQWKTRLHDYCLLEGYRGLTMNRNTKTNKCHISFKQPFKINVLRTEIPSSEWNTLEQCHRPKKSSKRWRQTRICPKKFKEHYVEASTLMQDSYHFWVKMTQQTTVTITWKTMVRTAYGCWSVGVQADEFMRFKFLFFLNDYFRCFREDIFCQGGLKKTLGPAVHLSNLGHPGAILWEPKHKRDASRRDNLRPSPLHSSSHFQHKPTNAFT